MFLSAFPPPLRNRGRPCPATVPQSCLNPAVSLSFGSLLPNSFIPAYPPSATTHHSSGLPPQEITPPFPFPLSFPSNPAYPPSVTRHRSTGTLQELAPLLLFVCCFPSGVTPDFFCLFVRFQSPRSLRIGCASVFVRVVSPVECVSGKTPKNLRLHRWLALFCPRLSPLSLLLLPNLPASAGSLSLFLFLLARASARAFPFPFSRL